MANLASYLQVRFECDSIAAFKPDPNLSAISATLFFYRPLRVFRPEIEEMLDKIIEFTELKDFIHEPMKTYSSGKKNSI